jgi:predicted RNA-binding protein with PIN domain
VLTGAALTDVRMTLIAGKAHQKHTEGGDFRQATYRAIRQGLKQAKSILLEPYYHYILRIPGEQIGRAMNDITSRNGSFETPLSEGEFSVLTGRVPAAAFLDYMNEVAAYTKGQGSLQLEADGYDICHNADEVLQETTYDSEQDLDRPTGSVFCTHGTGFYVPWDEVERYAHLQSRQKETKQMQQEEIRHRVFESDDLETIMQREFGTPKRREHGSSHTRYVSGGKTVDSGEYYRKYQNKQVKPVENYLLVDGYNIIFAWQELKELAKTNLDAARGRLMDILCDYQGYTKCHLILVFDAYKVKGNPGSVGKYHNIHVVYTKEAETADMYIEKVTKDIGKQYHVRVATSDGLEQLIIMGHGAMRISAAEFEQEVAQVKEKVRTIIENRQ